MRQWYRRLPPLLLCILALGLGAAACGGSGDGEGANLTDVVASDSAGGEDVAAGADDVAVTPDVPAGAPDVPADVPPPPPFVFVADEGAGEGGDIWLDAALAASPDGDEIVVRLYAGGFENVLGWAFDLRYHPGIVALKSVELHDVLTERTWQGRCGARERGAGRLNIGCSRFLIGQDILSLAEYGGPLVGPAEFATVRFSITTDGTFELALDPVRRLARSGDGAVLAVGWRGGSVTLHRAGTDGGQP